MAYLGGEPEDDSALLTPPGKGVFSPPVMFTCTYEARLANIGRTHKELSGVLAPLVVTGRGAVKALNSNYVHVCQPGFERFLKRPAPQGRQQAGGGRLAPTNARQRKPQGDATCFNSALEVTIIPGAADAPPPAVQAVYAANPGKYYAVKSFPSTGQTQVPGVVCPDYADGALVARLWAAFLTEAGVGVDPAARVGIEGERPIMVNFKFHLLRSSERVILNLPRIIRRLETLKAAASAGEGGGKEQGAGGGSPPLPFQIREIKHPQDGQNLSFKFVCPVQGGGGKKVRVNIFYRGKVNILGACDAESPRRIHDFLGALFTAHWTEFVGLKPRPDPARPGGEATTRRAGPLHPPAPLSKKKGGRAAGEGAAAAGPAAAGAPLGLAQEKRGGPAT
jgi:hypothetical protein